MSSLSRSREPPVLSVVYFIFNEGYRASSGPRLTRADLCDEAIRLGRILAALAPGEAEVGGLLALMLLHDSRRTARSDDEGRLIAGCLPGSQTGSLASRPGSPT